MIKKENRLDTGRQNEHKIIWKLKQNASMEVKMEPNLHLEEAFCGVCLPLFEG